MTVSPSRNEEITTHVEGTDGTPDAMPTRWNRESSTREFSTREFSNMEISRDIPRPLVDHLTQHGQEHLLAFWDTLDDDQRRSLVAQIEAIDFAQIDQLHREKDRHEDVRRLVEQATEPPAFRLGDSAGRVTHEEARARGVQSLEAGKMGVILVAGGQGTRLGFEHPKGMFPIGPVSDKTIFQIHVEKIVAAGRRYGRPIPLCLMTSPATHEETLEFFDKHDRFGLPEDDFYPFCQGTMPAVDAGSGKVLLADRDRLALSPDGHGGMLGALAQSGTLDSLRGRGIGHLFYFQVDNPLVDICGPEFVGYHRLARSELSSQVVAKASPLDRVGNVVQVDNRLRVIEYSDLPDEIAERRKPDGSLAIWAGSIAVHCMDLDFLARMANSTDTLPFHIARKKVAHVDAQGRRITPTEPNAIKFERFIFDLMPSAARAIVVEVDAVRHFGPLKNASGHSEDTPETVKAQLVALHVEWLRAAGVEVADGVPVEISPLVALDAAELAERIEPGTRVAEATYFG